MIQYPDYKNCPVNVANSILKYFECETYHHSLPLLDEILEKKKYKNVMIYLCDGLGTAMMKQHLTKDSFLMKHLVTTISSVFPPTTTASTTSFLSGLEPCEHGWLGWNLYFEKEDQIITMFLNTLKDSNIQAQTYDVAETTLPFKRLYEIINENGKYQGTTLYPFRYTIYQGQEDLKKQVAQLLDKKEKNFIHIYEPEPDSLMHKEGCNTELVKDKINLINNQIEAFASTLHDTLLIVTADHGLVDTEPVFISDYPELEECLIRDLSVEPRACALYVKDGMQQVFKDKFNQLLSDEFMLLSKEEVIEMKLFGSSNPCDLFEKSIGDYMAISTGNKMLLMNRNNMILKANHAGLTSMEMQIPLVIVECK